jgi:hypothetical protein
MGLDNDLMVNEPTFYEKHSKLVVFGDFWTLNEVKRVAIDVE